MANICRGRFFFFGKKHAILQILQQASSSSKSYDLSMDASRLAHANGDYRAPEDRLLTQIRSWIVAANDNYVSLKEGAAFRDTDVRCSTYNGDVSKRCIFNNSNPELNEQDQAFFDDWLKTKVTDRKAQLRNRDLSRLRSQTTAEKAPTIDFLLENIEDLRVELRPLLDLPPASFVNDWDFFREFNREVLGNRSDIGWKEEPNIWEEHEDDYALFAITADHKWWCPVEATAVVSVFWPDIYVGVAYLEEQGIYGQRLYCNGQELLKKIGPSGTLPDDCYDLITEDDETYRSLKWEYIMNWQSDFIRQKIAQHSGISVPRINRGTSNEGESDA